MPPESRVFAKLVNPAVLETLHMNECYIPDFIMQLIPVYASCRISQLRSFTFVNTAMKLSLHENDQSLQCISTFLCSFTGLEYFSVVVHNDASYDLAGISKDSICNHAKTLKSLKVEFSQGVDEEELMDHEAICKSCTHLEYVGLPLPKPTLYTDVRNGLFGAYLVCFKQVPIYKADGLKEVCSSTPKTQSSDDSTSRIRRLQGRAQIIRGSHSRTS